MSPNDLARELDGLDVTSIDVPAEQPQISLATEHGAVAAGQCYCLCCGCFCDNQNTMA